jgi:hypothetical protein
MLWLCFVRLGYSLIIAMRPCVHGLFSIINLNGSFISVQPLPSYSEYIPGSVWSSSSYELALLKRRSSTF